MSQLIRFAKDLALETGELIRTQRLNKPLDIELKQGNELVTNVDLAADTLIRDRIRKAYPGHLILSEELAPEVGDISSIMVPIWIVDPIDGTVNFAHGHSQSAVSIAFVDNSQIVAAVVNNPFVGELFWAEAGGGAYLNNARITVAAKTELSRSLIATGFPYEKSNLEPLIRRAGKILTHCADIRRLGSAALDICWVAMGRLDGYYESLSIWDFAAAQLIAKEAGAQYGHFSEVPEHLSPQFYCQDILVANPVLFPQLRALLQED